MAEHSIAAARASVMLYDDQQKKWIPSGTSQGLSKVHVYHHAVNNTFRVVGQKIQDHEVVINCAILKGLKCNQATATFHQWRDNRQMPSWFDVHGVYDNSPVDLPGLRNASSAIRGLIEEERKRGIGMDRIVLGGFSQGGALALFTYLTMTSFSPLAGVAAFSTWLPQVDGSEALFTNKSNTPILQCHGTADEMVPFRFGKQTSKFLRAINPDLTFKEYRGMGHHSSEQEMDDFRTFLDKVIPPI